MNLVIFILWIIVMRSWSSRHETAQYKLITDYHYFAIFLTFSVPVNSCSPLFSFTFVLWKHFRIKSMGLSHRKPTKINLASFRLWPPCCATPSMTTTTTAPTSNTASHDNHEKINSWVIFGFLSFPAKGRRSPDLMLDSRWLFVCQ